MKKALLCLLFLFALFFAKGQTTETFESATIGAQSFTAGGKTFNLSSPYTFFVYGGPNLGLGYNGSNRFIHVFDPAPSNGPPVVNPYGQTGTLKITTGSFKLNSFWLYLSGDPSTNPNVTRDGLPGYATINGKLAGITKFTIVKNVTGTSIGFASPGNGFELIDLATAGGANNTNIDIDELEITLSYHLDYFAIDNFTLQTTTPAPSVTTSPSNSSICAGSSTTFSVVASNATGYQWQVSTDGGGNFNPLSNGAPYSGVTTATLTVTGATSTLNGYQYRCVASGGTAPAATSNAATLTVKALPVATATPASATICSSSATNIALTSNPTGASFAWTVATASGTVIGASAGSGTSIAQTLSGNGTVNYTVTPTLNGCPGAPITVAITVNPLPTGTATPSSQTINSGQATAIALTSVPTGATFAWTAALTSGTVTGQSASSGTSIAQTLTGNGVVTYTVTPTLNSCPGSPFTVAVTVNTVVPTIVVNPATIPGATVGVAYNSQTFSGSGGTAPYTFAVSAGILPAGLSLNTTTGDLTGTPTAAGTFNFTIKGTDSDVSGPYFGTRGYTLVVVQPTILIAPSTLPNAAVATAYSQTVSASGGTVPYTYAITAGALPAGLTLSSTGTVSGTPTAGGTFNFTITATGSSTGTGSPHTGARAYSITVTAPTITLPATSLANANVGVVYSRSLNPAGGGTSPYTYAITAGALPAGLTLSSAGILSGTPTAGGVFNFAVTATDSSTGTGPFSSSPRGYTLTVGAATIAITPTSLPVASVAAAYSETLIASGGTMPYSYAVTSGALPAGLTLSVTGILSGTPTAAGTFNFTVTATDSSTGTGAPYSGSQAYTLTVGAPTIAITPATLPGAQVATAYSQTLAASGGTAPYTYAVTAGALPTGLILNSVGALSGLPTATGIFNFTITATDAAGGGPYSGTKAYSITVTAPTTLIAPSILPNAAVAVPYNQAVSASGGIAPYSYTITAGALPAGLTLSSLGTVSGTPTAGGTFNFTITATGSSTGTGAPHTGSRAYTLVVAAPTVVLSPVTLPNSTGGTAYSQTITSAGGTAPYTYSITSGALPPGLSFNSAGVLSGTPTAAGSFNFTVNGTDSSTGAGPYSGSRAYTLLVNAPGIVISPATLPDMAYAVSYNQTLNSTGGTAPYSYSLLAGALPIGISFNSAGVISGLPRSDGNFSLTVQSTDANGFTAIKIYPFMVSAPVIAMSPLTLPNPVLGVGYTQSLSSSGGIAPYSYSIISGSFPIGMSFSSAGVLSGTPLSAGTFTLVIRSTDDAGANVSQSYTLTIAAPTLVISPAVLPDVIAGTAYSQTLTTTGSIAPYSYSLLSGALPVGVSFSSAGVLSGTPTVKGTYNLTIRATDASSGPYSADKIYSLKVLGKTQVITMAATATIAYGDADFSPAATSDSGLPVTYSTSNPAIATIVAGKVHIVGTGQVTIFADQVGNGVFDAAVQRQQTLTISKATLTYVANAATKVYGAANPPLSGTITGFKYADNLVGATAGTATFTTTAATTSGVGSYAITGAGLTAANYTFVQAAANATALTISPKALIIAADNKEKFAGTANPVFTASYSGFAAGESQTVLTTQPVFTTTANTGSAVGTYDINVNGAAAANYSISYVKGVLTIKPGAPTSISLAGVTLYENSVAGTSAGTLSSTSDDPSATFSYTLVAGAGDTDNSLFAINGNRLNTGTSLNYENKAVYKVRVRSTTQNSLWLEKELSISLSDVNETPTLAAISNQTICFTTAAQTVPLTGISAGPENAQTVVLTVSSSNANLFENLTVSASGATGTVNYRIKAGATAGTATVTVIVKDNGGTANTGVDTYSRTFTITVNALPIVSVNSDRGMQISKGERVLLSATGGANYAWAANGSITGGLNSATIEVRPRETTTYTVTVTNASGCPETKTFTLTVLEDYENVKATNILSPNGDGANDKWLIDNIDFYPNNEVKVFDKAGRILYSKKGYDNSWDGTLNGNPLAEGTYYYVIDFGTNKRVFRGFITVVRND